MAVTKVNDMRGPYVVFDGEFIEKLPPMNDSTVRRHVSDFVDVTVDHRPPKKKLFGGQSEEHWRVEINCGTFISLWVAPPEKSNLDALVDALNAASGHST